MKKLLGFFILVILLVAISGCAQQAQPAKTTPVPTTIETTIATPEPTPIPTTIATPVATPTITATTVPATTVATAEVTTASVVANVTADTTGLVSTPRVSMTPSTKITVISMTNNTFTPDTLTVLPGTGLTWRNDDKVNHAVKGTTETGSTMFNSGDIIPGVTWSYTFGDRTGTFTVVDPGYPQMKCIIIVKDGSNFSGTF